ncbi:MAG TPA: hypothetical protein VJH69_03295 [Candidatus Paceibacterota bacterium]
MRETSLPVSNGMKTITLLRILIAVVGLLSVFIAPPWLPLICMALLALRFPAIETLMIGMLMDFVWLPSGFGELPLFTIAAIIFVWGLEPLRRELLIS